MGKIVKDTRGEWGAPIYLLRVGATLPSHAVVFGGQDRITSSPLYNTSPLKTTAREARANTKGLCTTLVFTRGA